MKFELGKLPLSHAIDVHVGKRIRCYRLLKGLTQSALGDAAGIKFQQIQKYEMGTIRVSASRLWSIAEAFEVPVLELIGGFKELEQATSGQKPSRSFQNEEVRNVLNLYFKMPPNFRKHFLAMSKTMSE